MSPARRTWLFGGVAAAAAVAGAASAWWHAREKGGETLDADFWAQVFDRPEGGQLALAGLKGKPLLINFWATWCPPCVEELPMLDAFFRDQAANSWQVVGLAIDVPSAVRKFLARTPVSFPTALAGLQGTVLLNRLGNSAGGLPFTLVVNGTGFVVARKMGKLDAADLDRWRRALIHG